LVQSWEIKLYIRSSKTDIEQYELGDNSHWGIMADLGHYPDPG